MVKVTGIPSGYKQTDVGVIPVDWVVKKIENIAPLQRGFDLPANELKNGNYPVVYSNGINNYHCIFKVKAPGVVTGRSGTIGKVTFVEKDYFPHNTSLWVTNFKGNDPKFIYYLYLKIKLERFGTGSGVPTLNRNDVHSVKIPLPPLPEQQAIASALSDVDALITALELLITKMRNIKKGAMQQSSLAGNACRDLVVSGKRRSWGRLQRCIPEVPQVLLLKITGMVISTGLHLPR